jgi:hypothetical protein
MQTDARQRLTRLHSDRRRKKWHFRYRYCWTHTRPQSSDEHRQRLGRRLQIGIDLAIENRERLQCGKLQGRVSEEQACSGMTDWRRAFPSSLHHNLLPHTYRRSRTNVTFPLNAANRLKQLHTRKLQRYLTNHLAKKGPDRSLTAFHSSPPRRIERTWHPDTLWRTTWLCKTHHS